MGAYREVIGHHPGIDATGGIARSTARSGRTEMRALTQEECTRFEADGLLVLRGWTPPEVVAAARAAAIGQLADRRAPIELEVDVGYPGAPAIRRQSEILPPIRRSINAAGVCSHRGSTEQVLAAPRTHHQQLAVGRRNGDSSDRSAVKSEFCA